MSLAAAPPCVTYSHRYLFLLCFSSLIYGTVTASKTENLSATLTNAAHSSGSDVVKGVTTTLPTVDSPPAGANDALPRSRSILLTTIAGNGFDGSKHSPHLDGLDREAGEKTSSAEADSSLSPSSNMAGIKPKTQVWYSTAGWMPTRGIKPDRSINLTVLPMLAFAFFVFGICIKCYAWMREQDRKKSRGQLDFEDDDEVNYSIITAGDQGYREVDLRSDTTSMYDTVNSFRSFRLPFNDHTVTSVKSLPNQPYATYRSIVLKKADEGVYDSVHSYKAFLEKTIEINDVDIEVELVDDYTPRPRSRSSDFCSERMSQGVAKSRKRRLRRHSGGRGLEGNVKEQAERERFRRHSEKSAPHPPHPESIRNKTFHRRSSPAILEPLLQGAEFKICMEESDEEEEQCASSVPQGDLGRQSSNSSSSTGKSSGSSRRRKEPSYKHHREKSRPKRASQDLLAERLVKGSSHSSGHCSDDSPKSSSSSKGSSSNELDSDSDVTDSGLVVDLQKPAEKSCFRNSKDAPSSQLPGDLADGTKSASRKVHRFKVSFVDDATLSAASD